MRGTGISFRVRREFFAVSKMNWSGFWGAEQNLRSFRRSVFHVPALITAVFLLFCIGCNRSIRSPSPVTVVFETTPPARVGAVTVDFKLADEAAKPVEGARLTTEADMTHAGMSPVFATVEEKRPGHYESTLKLGMAGDWVILLHGTLPTGDKLERQFELRNVQPN